MIYKSIESFLEKFIESEIDESKDQEALRKKIPEVKTYLIMLYINSGNDSLYNLLNGYITKPDGLKALLKEEYLLYKKNQITNEVLATEIITKSIISDSFLKKFVKESKDAIKPLVALFFSGLFENNSGQWISSKRNELIEVNISKYGDLLEIAKAKNLLTEGILLCEELIGIREKNSGEIVEEMMDAYILMAKNHRDVNDTDSELYNYEKIIRFNEKADHTKNEYMIDIYKRAGEIYEDRKEIDLAKNYYKKWIECLEKFEGKESISVARAYMLLAKIYEINGKIKKSIELLYNAEPIYKKNLNLNDKETIDFYYKIIELEYVSENYENLLILTDKVYTEAVKKFVARNTEVIALKIRHGEIYKIIGDYESMEAIFFEASKIIKDAYGENHFLEGRIISNRADVEAENNNFDKSLELYQKALEIISKSAGKDDIKTLQVNIKIGEMFEKMEDYESAKLYYNKFINERSVKSSSQDIDVLNTKEKLARVMRYGKKFDESKKLLKSIGESKESIFSQYHYELINTYKELGIIYMETDDFSKSIDYFQKSLKNSNEIYLSSNKKIIELEEYLGDVYERSRDLDNAVKLYNNVLDNFEKQGDKLETARIHKILCRILTEQKVTDKAYEHIKKASELTAAEAGSDSLLMLECLNLGSKIDQISCDYDEALKKLNQIVNILKSNFGQYNHNLAIAYQNIASILIDKGELEKVGTMLDDALKINLNKYGDNNLLVAENFANVAMYKYLLGDKKNALINFEKALIINNSFDKSTTYMTNEIYFALAELYEENNDREKAIDYYVKSLKKKEYCIGDNEQEKRINSYLDNIYELENNGLYTEAIQVFTENYMPMKLSESDKESFSEVEIYNKLSKLYKEEEKIDLAELYANKRMLINKNVLGEFSTSLLENYIDIANIQKDKGDFELAKDSLENAVHIIKKLPQEDKENSRMGAIKYQMGLINLGLGDAMLALKNLEDSVEIYEKTGNKNTPLCWNGLLKLAQYHEELGALEESLEYYERCKNICDSKELDDDKYDIITEKSIGKVYFKQEQFEKAIESYSIALKKSKKLYGENSIFTGVLYMEIGNAYVSLADYKTARDFFEHSKASLKNSIGSKHNNYKYLLAIISANELNLNEQQEKIVTRKKQILDFIKGN